MFDGGTRGDSAVEHCAHGAEGRRQFVRQHADMLLSFLPKFVHAGIMSTPCAPAPVPDLPESRRTYGYFPLPLAQRLTPDNRSLFSCGSNVLKGWMCAHPQTSAIDCTELG